MKLLDVLAFAILLTGCGAHQQAASSIPAASASPNADAASTPVPENWKEFKAPDGSFSSLFPEEAVNQEIPPDKRSYVATWAYDPGRTFTIGYRLSEKKLDAKAAATALDAVAAQFVRGKPGGTRKNVSRDGIPGVEIASRRNELFELSQYFVGSDRIYFLAVTDDTEKQLAVDSNKFFESVKLLKK